MGIFWSATLGLGVRDGKQTELNEEAEFPQLFSPGPLRARALSALYNQQRTPNSRGIDRNQEGVES